MKASKIGLILMRNYISISTSLDTRFFLIAMYLSVFPMFFSFLAFILAITFSRLPSQCELSAELGQETTIDFVHDVTQPIH